jgi:hypothetical protein
MKERFILPLGFSPWWAESIALGSRQGRKLWQHEHEAEAAAS